VVLAASAVTIAGQSAQAAGIPVTGAVTAVQKAWSYVPEYSSAPGIDEGTVRNAAGQAVPDATVVVFPYQLSGGKPGSVLQPVARATTDTSGHFVIHLPASRDALLINSRSSGRLNLRVTAFYPGGMAIRFIPLRAGARAAHVSNLVLRHVATDTAARTAPESPATCVDSTLIKVPNVVIVLGFRGSAAASLANGTFSYNSNDSTTMGAGVSYTSTYGGFEASGTTTQITNDAYSWPKIAGASNNYFEADAEYYDQKVLCSNPLGIQDSWTVTMNSVSTPSGTPGAEPISAGHCSTLDAGATASYGKGTQSTFQAGAHLTGVGFNINLSSQDGWNNTAFVKYTAGSESVPVCGVYDTPGSGDAGQITVHA
jgi:hypothetical protein